MTAPPAPTPLTGPRSGEDAFQVACRRRDYPALQAAIRDMSKRDAVDHLVSLFPHLTRSFTERNLTHLMAMDPEAFWTLAYADPTGDTAARNIDGRNVA